MTRSFVMFVCTGNTCRSPLAMALARVQWSGVVEVASAGLAARDGEPAADPACVVAQEHGADLSEHRSQRLDVQLVDRADWLIGMTRSHVAILARHLDPSGRARLGLLGRPGLDLRGMPTPDVEEVADPFGGDLDTYRAMADQLTRLLTSWAPHIAPDNMRGES